MAPKWQLNFSEMFLLTLLLLIAALAWQNASGSPVILTQEDIQILVDDLNRVRGLVNPPASDIQAVVSHLIIKTKLTF